MLTAGRPLQLVTLAGYECVRVVQDVADLLHTQNIYEPDLSIYKQALSRVRAASLNCYEFAAMAGDSLETRASILQRSLGIGDACTFRIIAKNVVGLLPKSSADLANDTMQDLSNLIRSYQFLDDMADRAREGDTIAAEKLLDSLHYTIAMTTSFETDIEKCLGLPLSHYDTSIG